MTMDWVRGLGWREEHDEEEQERENIRQDAPSGEPTRVSTRPVSVAASPARSPGPGVGAGPDWVPVGPSLVILGQTMGAAHYGRISGRVRAMVVSPDGERIYAGTANGGVWYSGNGGGQWLPLDSYEARSSLTPRILSPSLSIGALFVMFGGNADGSQDRVFVATGEAVESASGYGASQHVGIGMRSAGDGVSSGPVPAVLADPAANPWTRDTSPGASDLVGKAIYRIAAKLTTTATPALVKLFLATSGGLYVRDFTAAASRWDSIHTGQVWDVVLDGTRLWIATTRGLRVSIDDGAHFDTVSLPDGFGPTQTGANPPARPPWDRVTLTALPSGSGVYALSGGGRLWRAAGATPPVAAVPVLGLPYAMFGTADSTSMSNYATALTAWSEPAGDIVLAGGSTSLVRGLIAAPTTAAPRVVPTQVEGGTHADFHALVTMTVGTARRVFAASDGGIFRSDAGAGADTFRSINTGLAALEPFFLAGMPLSETMLFIGTQDNGAIRSTSPEMWTHVFGGDAGGVAVDPVDSRRVFAQYTNGEWRAKLDDTRITWFPTPPAATLAPLGATDRQAVEQRFTDATTAEKASGFFYSAASAVLDPATGKTLLAVGTKRPWISDDWGQSWKTLPTFTDPSVSPSSTAARDLAPRADQDVLGSIAVVKFAGPDRLLVITQSDAYVFRLMPASGSTPARWQRDKLAGLPFGSSSDAVMLTDIAMHVRGTGTYGSLYMTKAQRGGSTREHHVYWFNGTDKWIDAGLDIDAPTNAVVVDPLATHLVYVGTDVGVFQGTFNAPATASADPTWTWRHFSDGLPEAPVVDLVIDERPASASPPLADRVRLLRAALAGRGVFEIPVSSTRSEPRIVAFVRAHEDDLRRSAIPATPRKSFPQGAPTAARTRLLTSADYDEQRLDASPDIRVRRAPDSAFPPLEAGGRQYTELGTSERERSYQSMALQAAKRAAPPHTEPVDGVVGYESISAAEWQRVATASPRTNVLPFAADPTGETPNFAEVVDYILDEPDPGGFCSCRVHNQDARVDVVVHTRHYRKLAASTVKVALLRAQYDNSSGTPTAPLLPAGWRDEVVADRTRTAPALGAWLAGTAWTYVDATTPLRDVATPMDAREAGVATFRGVFPPGTWLLVAVVLADDDLIAATTIERAPFQLARDSRHVALRSVHADIEPAHHTFQEWHLSQTPNASYTGTADDQRIVERHAPPMGPAGHLIPKTTLHLCTREKAVASFRLDLPAGDFVAQWEILDRSTGVVVRTHPQFTPAAFTTAAASARVTSGQYAWLWDGRNEAGVFVQGGGYSGRRTYVSRLRLKDPVGQVREFFAAIEVEGTAYESIILSHPKDTADLVAAVRAAPQGPIDTSGQRITNDCDLIVARQGHYFFLGHGTMESTRATTGPQYGAIAVPHFQYKGWIERPSATAAYEIHFESTSRTDGRVTLANDAGPAPLNPYVTPPAAHVEGAKIGGTNLAYTTDGLLEAGILVRETTGTCAAPAARRGTGLDEVRARNASYGTFGTGPGENLATRAAPSVNKQTKRTTVIDALNIDTHGASQNQAGISECPPNRDEPLRMHATLQNATFGGLRSFELPMTSAAPAAPLERLAIPVHLSGYSEGSAYHVYHHAVVLAHTFDPAANQLSAWIPRKVIRGWNGQGRASDEFDVFSSIRGGRNVLVPSHITLVWYVELVPPTGASSVLAHLIGTGPGTFAALPNLGRIDRTFVMPAVRPAGQIRSVFRYRLQLAPVGSDHTWAPEGASPATPGGPLGPLTDPFSSHGATLAPETLDGDTFVGQSVMVLP